MGSLGVSFIAGVLSTLSPCVLPILPLIIGGALAHSKRSLFALALGLALSYVAVGMFVATIGFSIGLDADLFRIIASVLLIVIGVVLVSEALQHKFAHMTASVGNTGHSMIGRITPKGVTGQFLLGLLLGAAWSPCVGPTLGTAVLLASQGKKMIHVAEVMVLFGVGAALPLLILGFLSRELFMHWRGKMMHVSHHGKKVLGLVAIVFGIVMVSGIEKDIETALVDASPQWLTDITTKY
ncbi:MAG TPA: cytochrome c biogenesis CcdA family protein [Magnetospirillaceae bacterium]